jgi:hypothetical protein
LEVKVIHGETQEVVASVYEFMETEVDAGFVVNLKKTQKRGDRNSGKSLRRTAKDMKIGVSSA